MKVGDKIKMYRLEKGMTQEEVGKHLGVGKAAVQKYESGQVQNLKAAHIKKLCILFNRRPWDFIFDDDDEPKHSDFKMNDFKMNDMAILRDIVGVEWLIILEDLQKINELGQTKIKEYIRDIAKIDEYRK